MRMARGKGVLRQSRNVLMAGALIAASVVLSSCGFQPLYAQQGVTSSLASVEVVAPEGRAGYLLREHLDDAFGRNLDAAPTYRMHLVIHEARFPRGVRIDNVATRYEYVLTKSGRAFKPVLLAFIAWGNDHLAPEGVARQHVARRRRRT